MRLFLWFWFAVAFANIDIIYSKNLKARTSHRLPVPSRQSSESNIQTNSTLQLSDELRNIHNQYMGIDIHKYQHQKKKARNWLLSLRREDFSWSHDMQRAIIALQISKDGMDGVDTKDEMLMTKQLHIQISLAIARNQTKSMPLSDLSLYINALQASCSDPRNFYGFDLVSTLRSRVNVSQLTNHSVSALVYLTLCLNNATLPNDAAELRNIFSNGILETEFDVQSSALLASICISKLQRHGDKHLDEWIKRMLREKQVGFHSSVYEAALIIQALNEAKVDANLWAREDILNFLMKQQGENGSFGDILATYYVLPILSDKSLLSLSKHCHKIDTNGLIPIETIVHAKKKHIHVNYALHYGNPVELSQTLHLRVSEGTNFFDIMRVAQDMNTSYRFDMYERKGTSFVYSIGGIPNDVERGMQWRLHVMHQRNDSAIVSNILLPYKGNLKHLVPKFGDAFVFWMEPL